MAYTFYAGPAAKSISYSATKRADSSIKYIVLHYTGNETDTAAGNVNFFATSNDREAGAHFFVDDTSIRQSIAPWYSAYAVGGSLYDDVSKTGGGKYYGKCKNSNSVSIEMCSTKGVITPATIENALALTRSLMQKYNVPLSNVIRHFDVTGKYCPGWDGWMGPEGSIKCPKWNAFKAAIATGTAEDFNFVDFSDIASDSPDPSISYTNGYFAGSGELMTIPQFSNSSLAGYINRLSAANCSPRSSLISAITIHIAAATGNVRTAAQIVNTSGKGYHYAIDSDGTIGLFVDEEMAIMGTGDTYNDNRAVQIVCMNSTLSPDYKISDKCRQALVDLCYDICKRNFIFELAYNKADPGRGTLTLHNQFASINCPGPYLTKELSSIIADVNKQITQGSNTWVTVNHTLADCESSALLVQSTVSLGAINPYVAKVDKGIYNIDYNSMKNVGVVGVMLDAGYLFDASHNQVNYKPDAVTRQVKEVEKANMPYGFLFTTKARSIIEAANECRALRRVIYRHSPKLGIWLHLGLNTTDNELAGAIVERFYSSFVEWGLKSRCGIYANKRQAKLIGWPEQASYMPLWLEGEMTSSTCPKEELLTPSFFKLDDLTNKGYNVNTTVITPPSSPLPPYPVPDDPDAQDISVTRVPGNGYTDIILKPYAAYTGFKSWEPYTAVTLKSSGAYKILHNANATTDKDGFRKLDNCYLVAVGTGITNEAGVYVDVILENGCTIHCITGDQKADCDTLAPSHVYMDTATRCCSEFAVDKDKLMDLVRKMGDCSYRTERWKSKVAKFRVFDKNYLKK